MSRTRLVIVGAGVMGTVVGALAVLKGVEVTVYDDGRPEAGTPASAGMMIPGWSPVSKEEFQSGVKLLDELFGVTNQSVALGREAWSLSPIRLSSFRSTVTVVTDRVTDVFSGADGPGIVCASGRVDRAPVLLATGSWAGELWDSARPYLKALVGASVEWPGAPIEPLLLEWAPYKQLMVFERDPGRTWAGDGTSILAKNYTDARERQTWSRCQDVAGDVEGRPVRVTRGRRPYVTGYKWGVLERVLPGVYCLTGGGKSSTILSAHYAPKVLQYLL